MGKCVGGKMHGEVLTMRDDADTADFAVLAELPNDYLYGHCADCKQVFRWSVVSMRWCEYPGPTVVIMKEYSDEELEGLQIALSVYHDALPDVMFPGSKTAVDRRRAILTTMRDAIAEGRTQIEEQTSDS